MILEQPPFDVVTVPDFSGTAAPRFELRTLLFLAAWLENAGAAKTLPLHLACIGEPPRRVIEVAERAQAQITVHSPMTGLPASANKLRGLEVPSSAPRRLLLDTDVWVLGDLSDLAHTTGSFAAAPVLVPRWPAKDWPQLYREVGLPMPAERFRCTVHELGIPHDGWEPLYAGQSHDFVPMPPMYNSGVVWLSTHTDLRGLWEDYLRRARELFPPEDRYSQAHRGDQLGLALALQHLRNRGEVVSVLPATFHACWVHLYSMQPDLAEIRLFHAYGLGARFWGGSLLPAIEGLVEGTHAKMKARSGPLRRLSRYRIWNSSLRQLRARAMQMYCAHIAPS